MAVLVVLALVLMLELVGNDTAEGGDGDGTQWQ